MKCHRPILFYALRFIVNPAVEFLLQLCAKSHYAILWIGSRILNLP